MSRGGWYILLGIHKVSIFFSVIHYIIPIYTYISIETLNPFRTAIQHSFQPAMATGAFPCWVSHISRCHGFKVLDVCPATCIDGRGLLHSHCAPGGFRRSASVMPRM